MDIKTKSGAIKCKRKLLTKSDNYINSNETNTVDKLSLKTRGPYVVRNPAKLDTNDLPDDQSNTRKGETEKKPSQEPSQRKYSSTVTTTSLLGNRKFITHEIVKTKRKNRSKINSRKQEAVTKPSISNNKKSSSKNFKAKSQSSYKKRNKEDDVIYVLPTRNNNYQSVTNTNSVVSKQVDDSPSNLNNDKDMLNETCSGVDRIADEVLEGWIKRKEKRLKGSEHSSIIAKEKADDILFNLCVDLVETTLKNSDPKIQQSSTSSKQTDKPQTKIQQSVSRKTTLENIYDIDVEQENDTTKRFYVIENDKDEKFNYPPKKPRYRKPRILIKQNLKTRSFFHSKYPKPNKNMTQSYREIRKNSKKEFLNIIKKELETPSQSYKEPRNMFEALKAIARNRNKTKNRISFDDGIASKTRWRNDSDCEYDNPKLINTFKKYSFEPRSGQFYAKPIPRTGIIKNKFMTSIEVKQFHRSPDKRLQVITI